MPYRGKYGIASNLGLPFCLTTSEKTLSVLSKGVRHNPKSKVGVWCAKLPTSQLHLQSPLTDLLNWQFNRWFPNAN